MSASKPTIKQRALHTIKEGLLIAFYLWVVFGLLILHKSMILAEHHIDFAYHGLALINALALAKVVLLAKHLRFGDQLKNVLWYAKIPSGSNLTEMLALICSAFLR